MNILRIAWLMVWLFAGTTVHAQNKAIVDGVKESIKAGSAKELGKYLSASVDLTLDGKPNNYSKAQAEFVLRDFFRANPPAEFSILHQGSSKGGQPWAIGNYKSGNDTYRIWIKFKTAGNQTFVQEISFSLVKE
jgi:hypothetical protein